MAPPINVDFWTEFYRGSEDPDRTYHAALKANERTLERAEALWDWKDLSRGVSFETMRPALEEINIATYDAMNPGQAVESLGERLVEAGALSNATVVTPAFLLHLETSDPDHYAAEFPIFDARLWVAYAYLTGLRSGDDRLPAAATTSATKYGRFVEFFEKTIPDSVGGRDYERALFRFGGYISSLPVDSVEAIDTHLSELEESVTSYRAETGQNFTSPQG